jgi:hypothetical protein
MVFPAMSGGSAPAPSRVPRAAAALEPTPPVGPGVTAALTCGEGRLARFDVCKPALAGRGPLGPPPSVSRPGGVR